MRRTVWVGSAAVALALAQPAAGQSRVDRPGTVGLFGSGIYGVVTGNSRYGEEFDGGPGFSLGVRYVASRHWSLGLSFHSQQYDASSEGLAAGSEELRMTDIRFDAYFYRDRGATAPQYFLVGIGFFRPEIHHTASDVSFPSENLVLAAGMGAEIFIRETWGLDLSGRVAGYFGSGFSTEEVAGAPVDPRDGNFSLGLQGQVGIFYYLTR